METSLGAVMHSAVFFRKEAIISNLHIDPQTHLKPIFKHIHIQQL
jgi:hypothetical protein